MLDAIYCLGAGFKLSRGSTFALLVSLLIGAGVTPAARGDDQPSNSTTTKSDSAVTPPLSAEDQDLNARKTAYKQIEWTRGPATVQVGRNAELKLPAGYRFTGTTGAHLWATVTQNPADPSEVGIITPDKSTDWFMSFSYQDSGHVKDDEKDSLNDEAAEKILQSIREATDRGNQMRLQNHWPAVTIAGWERSPFYDPITHHLTWAVKTASDGGTGVNYNSRVLGRTGVMSINLVVDPASLSAVVPTYNTLVADLSYLGGNRYEEFRSGDKIAEYGLIGLMTGGAAVVAVKFSKVFIKLGAFIIAGIAALFGKIKRLFKRT